MKLSRSSVQHFAPFLTVNSRAFLSLSLTIKRMFPCRSRGKDTQKDNHDKDSCKERHVGPCRPISLQIFIGWRRQQVFVSGGGFVELPCAQGRSALVVVSCNRHDEDEDEDDIKVGDAPTVKCNPSLFLLLAVTSWQSCLLGELHKNPKNSAWSRGRWIGVSCVLCWSWCEESEGS